MFIIKLSQMDSLTVILTGTYNIPSLCSLSLCFANMTDGRMRKSAE